MASADWAFALFAAALLPFMVRASYDFGVTWDERSRHAYGEMVWQFMRGLRPRQDFLVEDGGNFYGGMFDALCAALEQYIPANRYVVRHGLNAVFGWIGIFYTGRLAGQLFGRWPGLLAMVLLTVSPRYLGDAMNNPKDLPFAATSVAALYYTATVSRAFPYISRGTGIGLVVWLALSLNIRAGALMYLGYLGLLVIGYVIAEGGYTVRRLADTAARLTAISLATLVLGTTFWPWAQVSPIIRPIQALIAFSNFPYAAAMLFAGDYIGTDALPKIYAPWWFIITTPPVVLAGLALASTVGLWRFRRPILLLSAIAALPIVLVIVMRSTLYDGVRHLLFVYPIFVVIATGGWTALLTAAWRPWVPRLAGGVLAAGILNAAVYEVRSYPNEITYFNEIVGGPKGAFGRYEMDYWGNCLLEAVRWSADLAQRTGRAITISGEPWAPILLNSERYHQLMFTPSNAGQHQLDVRLTRGPPENIKALAERPDALYKVTTSDGAVLCVVSPGPTFWQLQRFLQ